MNNLLFTNHYLAQFRLRTARHKRRMQHEDFEKQLGALNRERYELYNEQRSLGWIELETPIMRGWKRYFVLREDIAQGKYKIFFENLLRKVNTIQYSDRRDFKKKKRKNGKKIYVIRSQELLHPQKEYLIKHKFTEKELCFFEERDIYVKRQGSLSKHYVFTEPWRFILRVRPNIITKVQVKDVEIEKRLQEIDNYLKQNNLEGKLGRLVNGHYQWHYYKNEEMVAKYNPLKNKSLQQILNECRQELENDNVLNY